MRAPPSGSQAAGEEWAASAWVLWSAALLRRPFLFSSFVFTRKAPRRVMTLGLRGTGMTRLTGWPKIGGGISPSAESISTHPAGITTAGARVSNGAATPAGPGDS